jgi:hypothetical protein
MIRLPLPVALGMLLLLAVAESSCSKKSASTESTPSPWSWEVRKTDGHLSLFLLDQTQEAFVFDLGAAGVISRLTDVRSKPRSLLAPSWQGERTDRVIQWSLWSNDVTNPVEKLPDFEWRYNVTQGGCFDGTLTPTIAVEVDRTKQIVDVYALPQDQWKSEQREAIRGRLSCLTRYQMLEDGVLLIRRWVRLGEVSVLSKPAKFSHIYLEAWSPFHRADSAFDTVALALNKKGQIWKTVSLKEFKSNPSIPVAETTGYSVVCRREASDQHTAIGLVFGTQVNPPLQHRLNLMVWSNGFGILPALIAHDLETGTVLEHNMALVVRDGVSKDLREKLENLVQQLPHSRVIKPGETVSPEVQTIINNLEKNTTGTGLRTNDLLTVPEGSKTLSK